MPLEDPNIIDMIMKPKNGTMQLGLIDAGVTIDSHERLKKLIEKLKAYVSFIMSDEFKKDYPDIKPKDVTIKVICKNEPTAQMKQIDKIMPHGDEENIIKIEYEIL